ncbi:MAG: hypothetical protein PHS10_04625 [Thiovulaceae bacterium]|nr:hypothetical protein [Sulfurimonadaceae bacterium]
MRLTLNEEEILYILSKIEKKELIKKIRHQLEADQARDKTKKLKSADKATKIRTQRAKIKIQNGMNLLRMENQELTYYAIAKYSGVSYATVKKYVKL